MAGVLSRPLENDPLSSAEAHLVEHLQQICTSKTFESSATLKNLLTYLFENRNAQVSEYAIAIGALYRRANFDPQIDATVRVQISRLRRRLKDYYLSEGRATNIRFSIPLGTHQLVLEQVSESALALEDAATSLFVKDRLEVLPEAALSQTRTQRRTANLVILSLGCLVLVLTLVCVWQFWQLRSQARANTQGAATQLLPLWKEFCANGKPARIVIPNPTFFAWPRPNRKNIMARDVEVNTFADIEKSPELSGLRKQMGEPVLSEFYAVSSDVLASLKLMHYMDAGGASITTNISSDASAELFEGDNVILIGTPGTLTPFKSQLDRLYFKFDSQARVLNNPEPVGSEPREIRLIQESPTRAIYPGLVAFLPGNLKGSHLLVLAGSETAGLVTYLTSTAGSQALQEARNRAGGAPYFEAVILSEADGNTVLNSKMVEFRAFTPKTSQN